MLLTELAASDNLIVNH